MKNAGQAYITEVFGQLGGSLPAPAKEGSKDALFLTSPGDGAPLMQLAPDTSEHLDHKVIKAQAAQQAWHRTDRAERIALVEALSAAIRSYRDQLAGLIMLEGGKTAKEALGETDSSADVLVKTIKNSTLAELNGMLRTKERPPVGTVGLITSFNFPLVVACWTMAPALLAGNAVLWKPSEKTPLTALACKAIFDKAAGKRKDLLQILVGERAIGEALVAHEGVDMISATGSVAMGKGIKAALVKKKNNTIPPILELGGNNAVIISNKLTPAHLEWALGSLLNSFLGTTGQRCTNTRRLIVHKDIYDKVVEILTQKISAFSWDDYGYGPLIDEAAYLRFEKAKKQAESEGGKIVMGRRLQSTEYAQGYFTEPALALMPKHSSIMQEETFAPLLFITPYEGDISAAITLVNAPANAGLVNGIYTQNCKEAEQFAAENQAGHSVINSPKGTGTPAFDMGFGGNKDSGEGEILNAADPLKAFTRSDHFSRVAWNKEIEMDL